MGAIMPAVTQVGLGSNLIHWSEEGGGRFGTKANPSSTTFGHNPITGTCSACFLGMPAKFGGPGVQGVAPGEQCQLGF
eukprot:1149853-Pelagomonas_calceolata.AAC.2